MYFWIPEDVFAYQKKIVPSAPKDLATGLTGVLSDIISFICIDSFRYASFMVNIGPNRLNRGWVEDEIKCKPQNW